MKEKITMLNPRVLAAAVVATGAGAALFLGTAPAPESPEPAGGGPVPVAIPPVATEVPTTRPAVPAALPVVPPVTSRTSAPPPATKRLSTTTAPKKAAPKPRATRSVAPVTTQQPQPAGTEPNGSGGWQLPACYDVACQETGYVADPCTGTGTECLNATLGQLGIVNTVPGLIGGH